MGSTNFILNSGSNGVTLPRVIDGVDNDNNFITLIPLTHSYAIIEPSNESSYNGSITLLIEGGTEPYKIKWYNGHNGLTLNNISYGSYDVEITDFYGDYIIRDTILVEKEVEPINNDTDTPIDGGVSEEISKEDLCLTNNKENYQLVYDTNDVWINTNNNLMLSFSEENKRWEISGFPEGVIIKIDKNKDNTPYNGNWSLNGKKWQVNNGQCKEIKKLITINTNDETCNGLNNGSVKLGIENGQTNDYKFRIRGVNPYPQYLSTTIFNNLSPGEYYVEAKNNEDIISNKFVIKQGYETTNYNVRLTKTNETNSVDNKVKNYTINVEPNLKDGESINVVLKLTHTKRYNCPSSGCLITPEVNIDSDGITLLNTNNQQKNICNDSLLEYIETYEGQKEITLTSNDLVNGEISHNITTFDHTWSNCECNAYVQSNIKLEILKSYSNMGGCYIISKDGVVVSDIYLQNCIKQ